MRYFRTTNASRRYVAGGLAYVFEPVDNIGGSWLGVLAVDDSAATTLAAAAFPQVSEVTQEEYEESKKKGSQFAQLARAASSASVEPAGPRCGGCGAGRVYSVS